MGFAWAVASRELRGGLAGFRIFLICLALGVAGIAAVGSVTAAIEKGMSSEGQTILGGDLEVRFSYRQAEAAELDWLAGQGDVSRTISMRSMLSVGDERSLVDVKGVDGAYPLYGEITLEGGQVFAEAIEPREGVHGLVTERVLAERLGLAPGDTVRLGAGTFTFRGIIAREPDRASAGFAMGPRVLTTADGLEAAGLLAPGVIYRTAYRVKTPAETSTETLKGDFEEVFPEAGARWRDRANAAPGISRFVERFAMFMSLAGIAALAVGGVGIGTAVRGYLVRKIPAIAALRTLGATGGMVFAAYAMQIAVIAGIGIAAGLALGGGLVLAFGPLINKSLPIAAEFSVYPLALVKAGVFGALTAIVFTLWPLSWLRRVRPAELLRRETTGQLRWPGWGVTAALVLATVALAALITLWSPVPWLVASCLGGIAAAVAILQGAGWLSARALRSLSQSRLMRGWPSLRQAAAAVGATGAGTPGIVVALGLGLGVLTVIGQLDANMQRMITEQLPEDSPAFFFVDIQSAQRDGFEETIMAVDGTDRMDTAPMLRGIVTELNGVPAREAKIDPAAAWVLRGDRGVSYATEPPPGVVLTDGAWWEADYAGPPLVSFAEEEGRELGLSIGSTVTINILGRPITAEVANFRTVEWRSLGINFLIILSPNALAGAPHTHIATLYADREAEAEVLRTIGRDMPNVTAVSVRDQIARVSEGLGKLGGAMRWASLIVLLTGLAVLVGTAAAGEDRRKAEAAILKVLGATKSAILTAFALRSALTGAIAGLVALIWGGLAAWAVMTYVFEADFVLQPVQAIGIVLGGALTTLVIGIFFARAPLSLAPAKVLRTAAG
jgi:putative ABC transport system permease protein